MSFVQAEESPDEARRRSMELHQPVHSEPKECGHCDIDYRMDAALQGDISFSVIVTARPSPFCPDCSCRNHSRCCARLPVPGVLGWIRLVHAVAGTCRTLCSPPSIRNPQPGRALCSCFSCWLGLDAQLRLPHDI